MPAGSRITTQLPGWSFHWGSTTVAPRPSSRSISASRSSVWTSKWTPAGPSSIVWITSRFGSAPWSRIV